MSLRCVVRPVICWRNVELLGLVSVGYRIQYYHALRDIVVAVCGMVVFMGREGNSCVLFFLSLFLSTLKLPGHANEKPENRKIRLEGRRSNTIMEQMS